MVTTSVKNPKKSEKITTTIRMDKRFHEEIKRFSQNHKIDFSTFMTLSAQHSLTQGIFIEPHMSDEKFEYYKRMADDTEKGKAKTEEFPSIDVLRASYN